MDPTAEYFKQNLQVNPSGGDQTPTTPLPGMDPDPTKPGAIPIPFPGIGMPNLSTTNDMVNALNNMRNNHQAAVINPTAMGKAHSFDPGPRGHNYERYYNHPAFKTLGFSPFRDNEKLYNENSSWVSDMSRAASQWSTVFGIGMRDAMGFGNLTDVGTAAKYERAMAIGSSSRGGVGGFATNLYLNSPYTFGILAEVAVEEIALGAIEGLSGGSASGLTVPKMIESGTRAGNKIWQVGQIGKNILRTLDSFKDAGKARDYFNKALTSTGKFVNPLENTVDFMRGMNKVDNITNLAKVTTGFGAFYRDVRNVRLAWGESGLEGGMVRGQMEEQLLDEHMRRFGRPPTKEEAAKIRETASSAGYTTAWQNLPTIFFSNKLVFDNMFKQFKPFRRLTDDVVESGVAGKILFDKTAAKDAFSVVEKNWKGFYKTMKNPRAYGAVGLNYFKANLAEGLQESAQEVISGAAMDYYSNEWRGTPIKGGYWSAVADNLKKQVTPEGLEIFMSGFLMGGIVQPVQKAPTYLKQTYSRFKDPAKYQQLKTQREQYLNDTVNKLNDLYNDPAKYFSPDLENMVNQDKYEKGMEKASANGDGKTYHDIKDASLYEHIYTALKTGRMDTFKERLEDLRKLSPEEIQETYKMDQMAFNTSIDSTLNRMSQIQARFDLTQDKYRNPFNPHQYKYGSDEYVKTMYDHLGYAAAQKEFIFKQHSFDRTLERMTSILNEVKADTQLKNAPSTDFTLLFTFKDTQAEIDQLKQELKTLQGAMLNKDQRKFKNDKQKRLELLESYIDSMTEVMTSPAEMEADETNPLQRNGKTIDLDSGTEGSKMKKAYRTYEKYLRHIANVNDDYVFNEAVEKSFNKMVDYYTLHDDAKKLTESVNAMIDPGAFVRHAGRISEVIKHAHENRKAELQKALEEWVTIKENNDMLQLLHDMGVFFDPTELDALMNNGKLPNNFYYVEQRSDGSVGVKDEVPKNSADYRKAIDIISKFVTNLQGKPIAEADTSYSAGYNPTTRNKINDDKRTYSDYAAQYGFDSEAEESTVSLRSVLQKVSESRYASKREKILASRLLKIASEGEYVKFTRKGVTPGKASSSETIIDPRYSSVDYQGGIVPFEFVILHEEIHRRTLEALEKDSAFRMKIEELRTIAQKFHTESTSTEKPAYGLKDNIEFVAEAMSNDKFKAFLAQIPYDGKTDKTTWTEFVDSVISLLKKIFGRSFDNTVLNASIDVITGKIDENFGAATVGETKEKIQEREGGVKVTRQTPVEEIIANHSELARNLIRAYKEENSKRQSNDEDALDRNWSEKNDEQIYASAQFKAFVRGPWSAVSKAFKEYNDATGRTVEPTREAGTTQIKTPEPSTVASVPVIITRDMRQQLADLGFTREEVNAMTPAQAHVIINRGVSKAQMEAQQEAAEREVQEELVEERQKIRAEISGYISDANTIAELEEAEAQILAILANPSQRSTAGLSGEEINRMLDAKKQDLAFSFIFEDFVVGETVILNDDFNTKAIIDRKTDTVMNAHKVGDVTRVYNIAKSQIREKVKYKYSEAMEHVTITQEQEVTPQEQTILNKDVNTARELGDPDSIQEDIKKARESSPEQLEDDWLNNINEC